MASVIPLYKKIGETPLEALNRLKNERPEFKETPMSYAGRLDPMAEGVLLIIYGEALKEKDNYLKLEKTYEAEILFDIGSDTGDALGIIKTGDSVFVSEKELANEIAKCVGEITLPLPAFSSYRILGKPLFWWKRNNRINEIEIPERTTKIFSTDLLSFKKVSGKEIKNRAIKNIQCVTGDFRQHEIIKSWKNFDSEKDYPVARVKIACSSGTYIRGVAEYIAKNLNTSGMLISLIRTKIGNYEIKDCFTNQ